MEVDMAGDVRIDNSQVIMGSRISHSRLENVTSQSTAAMTPEMWDAVFRLADTYGQQRERDGARELKAVLDDGRLEEAKPLWQRLRSFLGDFANVSKIVEAIDSLMR
jgi:hypothetical protein